jgi:hypothetical protein
MSKHTDPVINKKIGSTEYYYNVKPGYFDGMEFWEAISIRAYLARENAKRLYKMQEGCGDKETYLQLEEWINDCYKAQDFNEQLLKERRSYGEIYK